jgi:Predicted acetyltransferase
MDEVVATTDQPDRRRYELTVDGQLAGFVTYAIHEGRITLIHTEVEAAYSGRHLGDRLAGDVLDDARRRGLRVRPLCPFVASYIRSHPEYESLVG